ncbi:MAG: hypothetical protein Q9220_001318 [cf. Caloplaca sp. 1 TL-2023]
MVYIGKRQTYNGNDTDWNDDGDGGWWYSDTAEAIKWAVLAGIVLFVILLFVGAWLHAKRRIRRGQAPLAYHRFLVRRSQRPARSQPFSFYRHQQNPYEMNAYPPPPPAYNHDQMPPPPMYEPPQGASKTNPDQQFAPPPGPPPQAGESSYPSSSSPRMERRQSLREQYNAGPPEISGDQLPPRPESAKRSWNPLKRFK